MVLTRFCLPPKINVAIFCMFLFLASPSRVIAQTRRSSDNLPRVQTTTTEDSMRSGGQKNALLLLLICTAPVSPRAQTYIGEIGRGDSSIPLQLRVPSNPRNFALDPRSRASTGGTVVVAAALSDGLVLAADSRLMLTFTGVNPSYKIASDSQEKIYDLDSDAIATYGLAFVLDRDVGSYIQDFGVKIKKSPIPDVRDLAKKFSSYFSPFYDQEAARIKNTPELGFLVAGYSSDGIGRILEINFPSSREPTEVHNTRDNIGVVWRGQVDVVSRLIKGFDPLLGSIPIFTKLKPEEVQEFKDEIQKIEYKIPYEYLMLQDGVDLSMFLVQATVDIQRFSFGTAGWPGAIPGVGGPVDVVTITPFRLEWIKKKAVTLKQ